jgi:DNA-binding Xre family transcriptional regulator
VKPVVTDRINSAITRAGIKKKFLSNEIGVSEQTMSAMLSGRRKINADEFYKICVALNMTPNELYGVDEENREAR